MSAVTVGLAPPAAAVDGVLISELHYDNASADLDEAVEVEGPAGADLTGWTVAFYNGADGRVYQSLELSGQIPDLGGGMGVRVFAQGGIQNGDPDGLALVDDTGTVREFLSYEGEFAAVDGPASGLSSTDIGVAESAATAVGESLQRVAGTWTGPRANSFGSLNAAAPPTAGACPDPPLVTRIHQIQGAGAATACAGEQVVVEAVVVGDYEGPAPELRGFYLQEEDADVDGDPATSEGLFVFNGDLDGVSQGDLVRVQGQVAESFDQTQLGAPTSLTVLESARPLPGATSATLPLASADALEPLEGMRVTFPQDLYVTESFQLGRFGQVVVSSGDRLDQPTAVAEPGAQANDVQAANALNRLIIDDTQNGQNPDPIIYGGNGAVLSAATPLRGGDVTTGATGVLTYTWAGNAASGNAYRLRPAGEPIAFSAANPRPSTAPEVGGSLTVAGFNVLNYFLTLDQNGATCGPVGFIQECRGAESAVELQRQRAKLLSALGGLRADVVGLIELENTTGVEPLADIVAGLNDALGSPSYDYVETGTIGTDVIKVGLIYRTAAVTPIGDPAILDSSVDPRFDDDLNRPSLAQSFRDNASGQVFTIVVNHFKSKGCSGAAGADLDQRDGQGCFNAARTAAATALADWVSTSPTGVEDTDVLVIGDLNSYAREDPIDVLTQAGLVDLVRTEQRPYSFVFDGQWGYLDYALATPSLTPQVTGAAEWHINADEAPVLDYNTNFKSTGQIDTLYAPDQYRTSDHDPVAVGLALDAASADLVAAPSRLWPPNHRLRRVDLSARGPSGQALAVAILDVTSSEADADLDPEDVPGDVQPVDKDSVDLRAERFSLDGRTYTVHAQVTGNGQLLVTSAAIRVPHDQGRGRG
jgi:predicted extracellular nuclease